MCVYFNCYLTFLFFYDFTIFISLRYNLLLKNSPILSIQFDACKQIYAVVYLPPKREKEHFHHPKNIPLGCFCSPTIVPHHCSLQAPPLTTIDLSVTIVWSFLDLPVSNHNSTEYLVSGFFHLAWCSEDPSMLLCLFCAFFFYYKS